MNDRLFDSLLGYNAPHLTYGQIVRALQARPIADRDTRERLFVALGAQLAS